MPHLIGLQFHSDGLSVAAMRPDQTLVLRPVDDIATVIRRTSAQRWKWSLGNENSETDPVEVGRDLFTALQYAMGDEPMLVAAAVPAIWNDRTRRALLRAADQTAMEILGLVRDTTALAIGAAHREPDLEGLCAVMHLGTHKLEIAIVEVSPWTIRVRARQSMVGLGGVNVRADSIGPLVTTVARFTARQAGVAAGEVRRFLGAGRRIVDPAMAGELGNIWGIPLEAQERGAPAIGAAVVAVGLCGMSRPWQIDDDLDESPMALFRGTPGRRIARATPTPTPTPQPAKVLLQSEPVAHPNVDEVLVIERYRSTTPPPTEETSVVAEVGLSGAFEGLRSVDAIRALRLHVPAPVAVLAHPPLAVLLYQFAFLRGAGGTLTLRHPGERVVVIPIERGEPCLTAAERPDALRAFEWTDGSWTWRRERIPWQVRQQSAPMASLVAAGLRARLLGFDDKDVTRAHDALLSAAPSVLDERRGDLALLGLSPDEHRALDRLFDGARRFSSMLHAGELAPAELHRLVLLLDALGLLRWNAPTSADQPR